MHSLDQVYTLGWIMFRGKEVYSFVFMNWNVDVLRDAGNIEEQKIIPYHEIFSSHYN